MDSEVPVVSGTVPVPVAGEGPAELAELEEPEELEFDDDDPVELFDDDDVELLPCNAACTAAVSSELTRFKAMPLAMLASPFASSVIAVPITLISESSADEAADWACACDQ